MGQVDAKKAAQLTQTVSRKRKSKCQEKISKKDNLA